MLPTLISMPRRQGRIEIDEPTLTRDGHTVRSLDFWPGSEPLDAHIGFPQVPAPHLKLILSHDVSTSIGLIILDGPPRFFKASDKRVQECRT